jgi:hypothetical protein
MLTIIVPMAVYRQVCHLSLAHSTLTHAVLRIPTLCHTSPLAIPSLTNIVITNPLYPSILLAHIALSLHSCTSILFSTSQPPTDAVSAHWPWPSAFKLLHCTRLRASLHLPRDWPRLSSAGIASRCFWNRLHSGASGLTLTFATTAPRCFTSGVPVQLTDTAPSSAYQSLNAHANRSILPLLSFCHPGPVRHCTTWCPTVRLLPFRGRASANTGTVVYQAAGFCNSPESSEPLQPG